MKIYLYYFAIHIENQKKMTGDQLRIEIKKLQLTQEQAASLLGITRQTLGIWLKRAVLDNGVAELASAKLNITTHIGEVVHNRKDEQAGRLISIPADVWEVIRNQAASLKAKDEQMADVIQMLREQLNKKTDVHPADNAGCADVG